MAGKPGRPYQLYSVRCINRDIILVFFIQSCPVPAQVNNNHFKVLSHFLPKEKVA